MKVESKILYSTALWGVIAVFLFWAVPGGVYGDIINTRHNLSAWSPYAATAAADTTGDIRRNRICVFCHTPHNADSTQAPLWGHMSTVSTFTVVSTTIGKKQPDGISRKCLGCHDGTVAVGAVLFVGDIPMQGSSLDIEGKLQSGSIGYIGTNLQTGHYPHPVSVNYSSAAYLKNIEQPGEFKLPLSDYNKGAILDGAGKVQCSSCHNPHNDGGNSHKNYASFPTPTDAAEGDPLWRKEMDCVCNNSTVCGSCHLKSRDTANCDDLVYDEYYEQDAFCDSWPF